MSTPDELRDEEIEDRKFKEFALCVANTKDDYEQIIADLVEGIKCMCPDELLKLYKELCKEGFDQLWVDYWSQAE